MDSDKNFCITDSIEISQITPINKKPLYYYIGFQIFALGLIIASLAIKRWYNYCFFEFGLVEINELDEDLDLDISTVVDLQDDICEIDFNEDWVEIYCPDFCDYVNDLQAASVLYIVFSSICLGVIAFGIFVYVLKVTSSECYWGYVGCVHITQILTMSLAMLLFGAVGNYHNIKDTEYDPPTDCEDFSFKEGFIFSLVTTFIVLVGNVLGYIFTRKLFKK